MTGKQVDYDRIAPTYNHRFDDGGLENIARALQALAREGGAQRILEVGCGTAHWLARLEPVAEQLYGLDLSSGMLSQARGRGTRFRLVQGRADWLPFSAGAFDLVYCVNAIHHFQQQGAFVVEAWRLLRPGGTLAVIGMDPHTKQGHWYVYDYFEGTLETDLARFPSWGMVLDWMLSAGFERTRWQRVEEIHDLKVGRAVLDDPYIRPDAVSQLALLNQEAYAAGLRRIEAALKQAELLGETLTFPSDITLAMLTGWVPV